MSGSMYMLVLAVIAALLWAGICAAYVISQKIRVKNWNMEYDPSRTIFRFIVTGVMGQAIYWFLALSVLGSVAYSKYCAANANAQKAYQAALAYQEKHPGEPLHTAVWHTQGNYPADSLESFALQTIYNPGKTDCYYAVTVDAAGKPEYAYWSERPLDAENLYAHTREEARKIVMNPFVSDAKLVGGYSVYDASRKPTQ